MTRTRKGKMNIFIAILLAVMVGVIFCQKWQINKFYQSAHFFRYYAKLHENKATYAEEEAETFRDLLKQLGYDVDRLSNGDKTRKPLTESEKWAIYDRHQRREARLKVADEELEEAEEFYTVNS
ncbi:hypothetical protein [Fructobacillus tropaeoli]|nr:hypothetical protein [Fructobacillus tropaeoli]